MPLEEELRKVVREVVAEQLAPVVERLRVVQAELAARRPREESFLTPRQAGDLLGVHRDTVREWIRQGRLTAHGGDGALRVSRSELLALRPGRREPGQTNVDVEAGVDRIVSAVEQRQDREAG